MFLRKCRMCLLGLVTAMSVAPPGHAQSSPPSPFPPIDSDRIARRLVQALNPAKDERAVIFYDPSYYQELAEAVQAELSRVGVHPVIRLAFDSPRAVLAGMADPANAHKREEEFVALLRPVFEKTDIYLWLPALALHPDLRWEKLIGSGRARGIHFHWIQILAGKGTEEIATLTRMYERAILETDYPALSREQDRLIAAIRGQMVRITAKNGTDLRIHVPGGAWFHKNDGDISPARARAATSERDREMEFPAGALRFIPDVNSAEGKLVVNRVRTPSGVAEGVVLQFEKGRVVHWRAEKGEEGFRALWESFQGDIGKVGEIVLGTNPLLVPPAPLPSGELPYYGYGAGYVRVSLGDNWESGGTNRSPNGRPLWLFLEKASIEAGGKMLIRGGELLP